MAAPEFDVVIIGGGPGGYVAAIRAAQLGLATAVVERQHLGGVCLNWGCIPTKALLRTADIYRCLQHAGDYGLTAAGVGVDLEAAVRRSRTVAGRLSRGVTALLRKNGVTVFDGHGRLAGGGAGARRVALEGDGTPAAIIAGNVILAAGARALTRPGLEADGRQVWTYREAMVPEALPDSLLVVGAGAIGIEFASFYRTLGAEVTVVELLDRVLPSEDAEISGLARKAFEKQGMTIHTGAGIQALERRSDGVAAKIGFADGRTAEATFERVILAMGITGNVEDLGLEGTQVEVARGHVTVDEWLRTGEPGVHAIGDLVGPPWLAHKAEHEGIICVERIAGSDAAHPLATSRIPACTYSHPQVASIGLTEEQAAAGRKIRVGRFPFLGNGKAIALGEPEGLVKTVFAADTGELLGAHMIGAEVTELVQGFSIGMTLETTEAELMRAIFPHPTLSEMMHESVLDAYGRVIHM